MGYSKKPSRKRASVKRSKKKVAGKLCRTKKGRFAKCRKGMRHVYVRSRKRVSRKSHSRSRSRSGSRSRSRSGSRSRKHHSKGRCVERVPLTLKNHCRYCKSKKFAHCPHKLAVKSRSSKKALRKVRRGLSKSRKGRSRSRSKSHKRKSHKKSKKSRKGHKKRRPTAYNRFVAAHMRKYPHLLKPAAVKAAAKLWNALKLKRSRK